MANLSSQRTPPALVEFVRLSGTQMRLLSLLVCLLALVSAAHAAEPITHLNVVLLQPGNVLEERVPSIDAMAEYIKAVEAASREAVVASGSKQSAGGYIVVAVRPGQRSNVWLDFDTLLDLEVKRLIATKVKAVRPFEALKGPVVFALKVSLWNGKEPKRAAPLPLEWRHVTPNGSPLEVGELVERIWIE